MKSILPVVLSLATSALFADWEFDSNVLTATSGRSEGMELTATLSGTRVSVSGIKSRGSLTVIDLQGAVSKKSDGTPLTIVSINGLKFSGLLNCIFRTNSRQSLATSTDARR